MLATHEERFFNCLLDQLAKARVPFKVIGMCLAFVSWKWRLSMYLNEITRDLEQGKEDTYVLVDAFDTVFFGDVQELERKFRSKSCDILLSKGAYTVGINRYIQRRIFPTCKGVFVNSAMMGKAVPLRNLLVHALSSEFDDVHDDQAIFAKICHKGSHDVKVDDDCDVFMMMSDYDNATLANTLGFAWENGRVRLAGGHAPCFVSGPGKTNLQRYISGDMDTRKCYIEPVSSSSKFLDLKRVGMYIKYFIVEIVLMITIVVGLGLYVAARASR